MTITRYGEPCPLCRTPLLLDVLQVRSAQAAFPTAERVTGHRCPSCQTTRPEQWTEAMRSLYGDA
jgi:ssDNA-binding Zn-finger/Zn-ribbon topoisomerase 1